jgi:ParB-like nuclease domain
MDVQGRPKRADIRQITVGNRHARPGDPQKVAEYHAWLMSNPVGDLPPIEVREKPGEIYRIHDGRHRFLAYVLAERGEIPIVIGDDGKSRRPASAIRS